MALGKFTLADGKSAGMDQKVSVRSNTFFSPFDSSFAAYLKEALATDLRTAGLLDAQAPVILSAELTDSQIDVPAGDASATIAAQFTVTRSGQTVYRKELRQRSSWKASFVGIEAIPAARNEYEQLYRKLSAALLEDPEFRAAVGR
jgi:hypothetical protein